MATTQKLWRLLDPSQRRSALVLMAAMLIGMVLETLGIGLVIPALGLMASKDIATSYPVLKPLLTILGNPSHAKLVMFGMSTLVAVYTIKTIFLAFLVWQQTHFAYNLQASLSQQLFACYLYQPYTFHLQRNSAQLIRNATGEVNLFTSVMLAVLVLLTEGLVLIGIVCLLLAVEPLGALLVVTTLVLAAWGFHHTTRTRISRWGKARQYHEGLRIQHLQQGLGGAKDVKLLGREENFLSQYELHNVISANVGQRQNALQQFPRLWLEWLAVAGLGVLVLVMISQNRPLDTLLPTLGLFAAAAFRLMPSINRVLSSIQTVRYATPVINVLHQELSQAQEHAVPKAKTLIEFKKQLSLHKICFQYADSERSILQNIDLNISCGASIGFIGGSGAGKSTLVDLILGLLTPVKGEIKIDGVDIQTNLRGWQDQIGYVPQTIFLTDDTLRHNIAFGVPEAQINDAAIWHAIQAAQLQSFVDSLAQGVDTIVGERGIRLSGGQRQRIGIARALYHDPAVLVLDEATSSLDSETEYGVMQSVRNLQGQKTILIIAHRHSTVEHCDLLYCLEDGEIVNSGIPSIVLKQFNETSVS